MVIKHYAKWENPDTKAYIFSHPIYMKSRKGKIMVTER